MKYLGEKSISHILKIILGIFWYIGWLFFLILIISSIISIYRYKGMLNIIATIGVLVIASSILFIIFQLRNILGTLISKNPFSISNVYRFRNIGFSTLLVGIFILVNDLYFKGLRTFTIFDDSSGLYTNIEIYIPFLLGVFSLILAEIFKIGYQIHEENKLTI
ncbi:MAG: DUF2975 domain-containing protein [Halanaerobiales bacterium]|nr:DUF2975 domain-containing protein [Halanaerobiales bacterium]